jgi:fibronectin-binding autotransporter adhesin
MDSGLPRIASKSLIAIALGLLFGLSSPALAQLVADGATNTINGFVTNVPGTLIIGTNGSFTRLLITNAGVVTNSGEAYIGRNYSAGTNRVEVAGANSSWQVGSNLWVGNPITGWENQLVITDGGSVSCYAGNISGGRVNSATVSGAGSSWTMQSSLAVGDSGLTNRLIISQGGYVASSFGRIGTGSRSSEAESHLVLVTDPGSLWTNYLTLYVGDTGDYNQLVVSNGGTVINWKGIIGNNNLWSSNNTATVTGAGSAWYNQNELSIGYADSGNQLIIADRGTVTNDAAYLGRLYSSKYNSATVTGQGSVWKSYNVIVGHTGASNNLMIAHGGAVQSLQGHIGFNFNTSNNVAVVTDPGSTLSMQGILWVGYAGQDNRLIVTNGGTVLASNLFVGYAPDAANGNRVLIDGGTVIATDLLDIRRGQVVLQAGLVTTAALWLTNGSQSQIIFSGGTLQSGSTIHDTGSPLLVGGSAIPATFEMIGTGSQVFSSGVLVASNGVLKGNGSITGNVSVAAGGSISPGAGIGQLTVNGALVLSSGSTTVMELDAAAGTNDNFLGLTSVTYGGTLRVTNTAGILTNGAKFKVFTAGVYSGAFDALEAPNPGPALKWNANELGVDGTLRVVSVASPPPTITTVALSGNNLTVSASGGVAYDPCYLLTSTNVAQALATWARLATNQFDGNGKVNFTNAIVRGEARRFFRLATD